MRDVNHIYYYIIIIIIDVLKHETRKLIITILFPLAKSYSQSHFKYVSLKNLF